MKHVFTCVTALLATTVMGQTVEDANVYVGNLSSSLYWDSYDDNTKILNNLNFSVYADGSNSNYVTPPFAIMVYVWDGSNPTFVQTYNDAGIYHFGARDYANQDIDLSDLQLPAGAYRIGVYVDANDDIPDSADDPGDNAALADGEFNFTPGGGSSAGISETKTLNTLMVFPNPAKEKILISWENTGSPATIGIHDLNGRLLRTLETTNCNVSAETSDLPAGMYTVSVTSAEYFGIQKFVLN